jgi:biotin carboxylase
VRRSVIFVNTRPSPAEAEPCFRAARLLGLDVILIADSPVAVPEGSYAELIQVDTYDLDALLGAATAVAARRGVMGVVCWGDRDVEGTAGVAAALDLPGHPVAAARVARDKAAFRDRLATAAPDLTVRHRRLNGDATDAAADGAREVGFPAIVKPAGASASKGIHRVADVHELREAIELLRAYARPEIDPIFRHNHDLVLEEYIEGTEHSVEGLMHDGRLEAAAVTDKWVDPLHSIEYLQIHPTALGGARCDEVLDAARRTATAVGLGTGAFHLELRVRPDGSIRVLELNARTGGGYIATHLIPLSRGYDFITATLRLACALGPAEPMPPAVATAGSYKLLSASAGRFDGVDGIERALAEPGVVAVAIERPLGAEVLVPPDGYTESAVASVIAVGYGAHSVIEHLTAAGTAMVPRVVRS